VAPSKRAETQVLIQPVAGKASTSIALSQNEFTVPKQHKVYSYSSGD
jgi:hypothetical protein